MEIIDLVKTAIPIVINRGSKRIKEYLFFKKLKKVKDIIIADKPMPSAENPI